MVSSPAHAGLRALMRTSMLARLHTDACVRGAQCENYCSDILSLVDKNVVDVETEHFSGDAAVHSVGICVMSMPSMPHVCALSHFARAGK